jgi:hypothetical protein
MTQTTKFTPRIVFEIIIVASAILPSIILLLLSIEPFISNHPMFNYKFPLMSLPAFLGSCGLVYGCCLKVKNKQPKNPTLLYLLLSSGILVASSALLMLILQIFTLTSDMYSFTLFLIIWLILCLRLAFHYIKRVRHGL